jgi:hypothetical protein
MFCSSESWDSAIGLSERSSLRPKVMRASYPPRAIPYSYSRSTRKVLSESPRLPHRCPSTKARSRAPTLWPASALLRAPSVFLRAPLPLPSVFLRSSSVLLPAPFPFLLPPPRPLSGLLPWHLLSHRRSLARQMARQIARWSAMRGVILALRRVLGPGPCRSSRPRRCPVPPWFLQPDPAR